MPSLTDTLANLHKQSEQIIVNSAHNDRPSGPFVQALLGTPEVLSLIREADPSEARLFKFVGQAPSGNKHVEKRDGGVITPLKDYKRKAGANDGRDQVGVMLKTAMTLVEDYRPGPRARAHIQNLVDVHQAQMDKVAELERLIAEATERPATSVTPQKPTQAAKAKPTLSTDEAIKAEEAALKRLEAHLAAHRQTPSESSTQTPAKSTIPRSPSPPPSSSQQPIFARTPAKTPTSMPHIANSLVTAATPRRVVQPTFNRFSPLKFLGTPRAPTNRTSLAPENSAAHGRTIFSRPSALASSTNSLGRSTSSARAVSSEKAQQVEVEDEDQTVRFGTSMAAASPEKPEYATAASASVFSPVQPEEVDVSQIIQEEEGTGAQAIAPIELAPEVAVDEVPRRTAGVVLESETVQQATAKIHTALDEMMHQHLREGEVVENDAESIVTHLYKLSRADPPPPPSPSTASSISSLSSVPGEPKAPPITQQTILLAQLLLMMLRSPDASVTVQSTKDTLGSISRARGWEAAEELATKIIYLGVAKGVLKIDRKGGQGGKVLFKL